ncbi:phosphoglycerol transferase MdoB-like AlkP superfamily enzyme [Flavobacterium cauense R2A-7]|uniref:Phosphoglycerol transferase MdoB-like AlkP superfamily enzyme n=1 Tax=Flavobacterium cauense R2A-7 TaxID=1341154 RepID=A0A562M192_9FLAO|nr:LTA synthase family protein [Flavobacterium cauense]KGO81696.1 sulfatase [Flavobacterium cauense R2A-7]TWI13724.1 phosphoglycerol transferase MdoB-like AlkP superfamily enzyme [Flavobacterium cauense R2A-7]
MKLTKSLYPFLQLGSFYLIVNLILRVILIFHPITQSSFGLGAVMKIFLLGIVSDFFVFTLASVFLWLYQIFLSDSKYHKPWGYIIFGLLLALLLYVSFFNTILNEYGGVVPTIGIALIGLKTVLFGLLLFLPKYRKKIRFILYSVTIFIFVLVMVQNAVSEFFFWNEFGVKYNFIAVDYLVYTNTVIGNIMESYPVVPLFAGIGIVAAIATVIIVKKSKSFLDNLPSFTEKIKLSVLFLILFGFSLFAVPSLAKLENSQNVFTNELQSNGVYKFYLAFMNSELDYFKFYPTLPDNEAYALLKQQLPDISNGSTLRQINGIEKETRKNVVLITIESLSADFMKAYGNDQNITPFLDSLADKSLFFTNLYATGNRTVRGLEAVTLCIPPTAGESVVKREDNKDKFSTASVFRQKGYGVNYLYGGDAYFDNMQDFFSGNGYSIVDKKTMDPAKINFANIWGVCDGDMANKAIEMMDEGVKSGKPFFTHWMTVSNHRPFTYPDGKIDIPANSKSREGGVKYTDYALRQFFTMAEKQAWFKNTVFVIVADHCASSSGKTELPMEKYRIPAMIYAPGFIQPEKNGVLMSQIDLMPTLFGLLHFNYQSKFYGEDVMKPEYKPRAFIATYEDLGLIKNNILTIIAPVKKVKQFDLILKPTKGLQPEFQIHFEEKPRKIIDQKLVQETISYYQTASEMLKNKKYQK